MQLVTKGDVTFLPNVAHIMSFGKETPGQHWHDIMHVLHPGHSALLRAEGQIATETSKPVASQPVILFGEAFT